MAKSVVQTIHAMDVLGMGNVRRGDIVRHRRSGESYVVEADVYDGHSQIVCLIAVRTVKVYQPQEWLVIRHEDGER